MFGFQVAKKAQTIFFPVFWQLVEIQLKMMTFKVFFLFKNMKGFS